MKTKIAYVLVSSRQDIYLEQAYISMHSLRYHMPEAHIVLLTDQLTADSLIDSRKTMIKYVDELIIEKLDNEKLNAHQRSRQLKTTLRNRVKGDFLYIDCDTVIEQPLDSIDDFDASIAACRDTHSAFIDNPYRDMCIRHGHLLEWPIGDEIDYFNSGVIYVKDCPETHSFYKHWNENLISGYRKNVYMDQPSFAKTNYEMGHIVKHLPNEWNCQLKHGIKYLKDAFIVHYLCTNPSIFQNKQLFLLNDKEVLLGLKHTGETSKEIEEVIKDPFKGLAEVTHCFAGDDIYFFQAESYNYLRSHYSKKKESIQDRLLLLLRSIGMYKNRLLRK